MKITRDTRCRYSPREKPLYSGKPSPTLPLVYLNQDETIQDPFDLDKDLLQSPSQPFLLVDKLCQIFQVSASQMQLQIKISASQLQNFRPATTSEFWPPAARSKTL